MTVLLVLSMVLTAEGAGVRLCFCVGGSRGEAGRQHTQASVPWEHGRKREVKQQTQYIQIMFETFLLFPQDQHPPESPRTCSSPSLLSGSPPLAPSPPPCYLPAPTVCCSLPIRWGSHHPLPRENPPDTGGFT